MPCARCGARQHDPARGPSAWKRGVADGRMVLICPSCQCDPSWTEGLDRCAACGSSALVRTLGSTSCRECGQIVAGEPPAPSGPAAGDADQAVLADEVAAAVRRVLGGPAGPTDQ